MKDNPVLDDQPLCCGKDVSLGPQSALPWDPDEYVAFADVPPGVSGIGIEKEWKWGESLLPFLVSPSVGQQDAVEVLSACQTSWEA